jgi:hypothetical protein
MTKMQSFFKFGRIFSVKLQRNPSGTWQQCLGKVQPKQTEIPASEIVNYITIQLFIFISYGLTTCLAVQIGFVNI